jgi:hypothetical protein
VLSPAKRKVKCCKTQSEKYEKTDFFLFLRTPIERSFS